MNTNLIQENPDPPGRFNKNQCFKATSMFIYVTTAIFCIVLMGYGMESGMNEVSMFAVDFIIYLILNICHITLWNTVLTAQDGSIIHLTDRFTTRYYLGAILQNIVYIFFFFFFHFHFFLNSMTFIMICYYFILTPLNHLIQCLWIQISNIYYVPVIEESSEEEYKTIEITDENSEE